MLKIYKKEYVMNKKIAYTILFFSHVCAHTQTNFKLGVESISATVLQAVCSDKKKHA